MYFFTALNEHEKKGMPVAEQVFQSNRKASTGSCLKLFLVKIFIDVIRKAIYHIKGIYTNTF